MLVMMLPRQVRDRRSAVVWEDDSAAAVFAQYRQVRLIYLHSYAITPSTLWLQGLLGKRVTLCASELEQIKGRFCSHFTLNTLLLCYITELNVFSDVGFSMQILIKRLSRMFSHGVAMATSYAEDVPFATERPHDAKSKENPTALLRV